MKVVLIDSGCSGLDVEGIHFFYKNGQICSDNDIDDRIGHGTAIANIINQHNNSVEIFVIKLFDSEETPVDENLLIHSFEYVLNNVKCDIINLSLGIRTCENEIALKNACDNLWNKGIMIVSAFDNEGAVSFPAMYENVIGVLSSEKCTGIDDIRFVGKGSCVNVYACGRLQRVKWINNLQKMVQGNSFSCAHVTGILSLRGENKDVWEYLQSVSVDNVKYDLCTLPPVNDAEMKIERAAIFPLNKEMHSLISFQDLLPFEISAVYDTKYSFAVGMTTNQYFRREYDKNYKILHVLSAEWDQFDTIIVGHIGKILEQTKNREYFVEIFSEIIGHNKYIYALDDLEILFPEIEFHNLFSIKHINDNIDVTLPSGMLYCQPKPVLEVCGTSSKQGKFTLQLILRRLFLKEGYTVGQLGTEPTSLLFGMDEMYDFGYENNISIDGYQVTALLNQKMYRISKKSPDIIITGAQGNVLMENTFNLKYYTFSQIEFLLGTLPDAIVLCINTFDDIEEIKRKVLFLESIVSAKVIALVIFPTKIVEDKYGNLKMIPLEKEEFSSQKEIFSCSLEKKTYILGEEDDMLELYNKIVDFFSVS